ncbi:MAG: M3 family metallopeptidase [Microscillaceae bacterium]|nr:M3 family metallopeptidase [Microscillaceae bacterium]
MNPLLQKFATPFHTPPFDSIKNEHFLPAIQTAIAEAKAKVQQIIDNQALPTFENTIEALEQSGQAVDLISAIFFNLNHAETNEELQKLAKEISPLLSEYGNDITLNENLFQKIKSVYEQRNQLKLNTEQSTLLEKTYKSFVRNGANLNETQKQRLREIDKEKSQLSLEYSDHVLADTNNFELVIENPADLVGFPESVLEMAAQTAQEKGKPGKWVFTLKFPSYDPFMKYTQNRDMRQKMEFMYANRGFRNNENDNRELVKRIAQLRHERATLLGYASHADFVLEERMASNVPTVRNFLDQILTVAKPVANQEIEELTEYANELDGIEQLERWDFAYYSEKLKKEKFNIDDEILKPYFKLENVIEGIFKVSEKLYNLKFVERKDIAVYHPEVIAYEVQSADNEHIAVLYADFFPRAGKQGGAWMTSFRGQKKENGINHRPHISIVCNFTKSTPTKPSLLTFNEVTTFFHEFGHALHGMLADCQYESLSGTNVYWDFVELPSQFFENWAYEKESLDLFARHYETNEPIPAELIQKIKDSANYMSGYQTVRQISFGKLDMAWHAQNPQNIADVAQFENATMAETALFPTWEGTNMSTSFTHIFSGGYAAGYYSYKWAEVLEADAFELFQEKGMFDTATAQSFKNHILAKGGSEPPMTLYKRFRGKEPAPEALLKKTGLIK